MMRFAGNFHPEWGYLAPAPSFLRTARIIVVATAVGATAGAGVVFALVGRPNADAGNTSVAARTMARPVASVAAPASAAARAQLLQGRGQASTSAAATLDAAPSTTESRAKNSSQPPAAIGALAEVPAKAAVHDTDVRDQTAPAKLAAPAPAAAVAPAPRKVVRRHHYYSRYPVREAARNEAPNSGVRLPFSLNRLFNYGGAPQGEYFADDAGRGYSRDDRWNGYYDR